MNLGTMLGVWAHPDDEAWLMGGLMADAAHKGRRTVLVTATRGEEGSQDHERWPPAEMARIRETELKETLRILGVSEHRWLDYYDGACAAVPTEEAVQKIAGVITEVEPDSVLTFGPDGMTGHPDHKAVGAWTTLAFEQAAIPGAKLYYACVTPAWMKENSALAFEIGAFYEGAEPAVIEEDDLAINFELPPGLLELKFAALTAQESQIQGLIEAMGADFVRDLNRIETFRLAEVNAGF